MDLPEVIANSAALAVFVIAGLAVREWRRTGDRTRAVVALAVTTMAFLAVSSRIGDVTGTETRLAIEINTVAFFASAYTLLLIRHSLVPLSRAVLTGTLAGLSALVIALLVFDLPSALEPQGPTDAVVYVAASAVWLACIIEPAVTLWRLGAARPLVQRAQLRSISMSYVAILTLSIAGAALPRTGTTEAIIGLHYVPLVAVIYASFTPPRWLRRMWRLREERALTQVAPLFFATSRHALAARAADWAVRLLGGDAGYVLDDHGEVIGTVGIDALDARALGAMAGSIENTVVEHVADGLERRRLIRVPLRLELGVGQLVVVAGPFTPTFGGDERALLEHYAAATATALDHLRLTELKHAFLTSVSHELRTPLTAVQGIALTLSRPDADGLPADARDDLRARLQRNATKLGRLLNDLLDLDALKAGGLAPERRAVEIAPVIRTAFARITDTAHRPTQLSIPETLNAFVDPVHLQRIAENLIANVVRHTPPGTKMWIEAYRDGSTLKVVVEDNGAGVPVDVRAHIFEAFRHGPSPSAHSPGTGVGLTLVARFAELHGGDAWVEGRPGGGARFVVRLADAFDPQTADDDPVASAAEAFA